MSEARDKILAAASDLKLTMNAQFVPWSQSRHKGEKNPDLNWRITIYRDGQSILITDYSAGMAHAPSYKQMDRSLDRANLVKWECEHGRRGRLMSNGSVVSSSKDTINPDLADVLYSLASDYDVLDYAEYEQWASEFGYDPDSRKGETVYRACMEIALKLRNGVGEDGMQKLREATQDY